MSTDWHSENGAEFPDLAEPIVETIEAPPLPPPHSAEADVFARHEGVLGHKQQALAEARITLVGAGGLNSWVAVGLARSGARNLTVIDQDVADRTNLSRQLYFVEDVGQYKTSRLIRNLAPHTMAGGTLTSIPLRFEEAVEQYTLATDLLIVGVDNNACRLAAVTFARKNHIPAVFTMLSLDGMRSQCFLQGPDDSDACLWCALPNLDPEKTVPCAASVISSCFLAASFALFFAHRALMGWSSEAQLFNWSESRLLGNTPQLVGLIARLTNCTVCCG